MHVFHRGDRSPWGARRAPGRKTWVRGTRSEAARSPVGTARNRIRPLPDSSQSDIHVSLHGHRMQNCTLSSTPVMGYDRVRSWDKNDRCHYRKSGERVCPGEARGWGTHWWDWACPMRIGATRPHRSRKLEAHRPFASSRASVHYRLVVSVYGSNRVPREIRHRF